MTDAKELESWIAHAEEDYLSAKALLKLKKSLRTSTCFHAQQCAEKYLKALLLLKGVDFPKTHDLPTLNTMCNKVGILTGFLLQELVDLTEYAIRRRYPGNEPTLEEAKDAIEIANNIRKFSRKHLGLK
jgi:HEPN domain-containing protein